MNDFYNQPVMSKHLRLAQQLDKERQIRFSRLIPRRVLVKLEQNSVEQQYKHFAKLLFETYSDIAKMGEVVEHLCQLAAAEIARSKNNCVISYQTIEGNAEELKTKGALFAKTIRELNENLKSAKACYEEIGFILQRYYHVDESKLPSLSDKFIDEQPITNSTLER